MSTDKEYMQMALDLAVKGLGNTSPNPMVGAVIVKDGRVIGKGFHERYGDLHAERNALRDCTEDPKDATMYVTLEPCCHTGKQPPCTDAVIASGIRKVVVGSSDPNPEVAGKGIQILREHGIEVVEGFMKEECDALNYVFFHYITKNTPYVVMKYAMTIDGKIATYTGLSKWVSCEASREDVQQLRKRYSSIMVGIGTVLADDPMLTCRIPGARQPVRVICDSDLNIPVESNIVGTARDYKTIIATSSNDSSKKDELIGCGCQILDIPSYDGLIDLEALMRELGKMKIDSVLIEGGGTLNWSMVKHGLVDRVVTYIAPKFFGGDTAKSPVEGQGFEEPYQARNLKVVSVRRCDTDIVIESEVIR